MKLLSKHFFKRTGVYLNNEVLNGRNKKSFCCNFYQTFSRNFSISSLLKLKLGGIFPPIPTPFKSNGDICYNSLEYNFNVWNRAKFSGYLVEGSNGEYVYLKKDERIKLVERCRDFAGTEKLLLAGSGCESTRDTIEMSMSMAKAGADAVMVVTPSYYKNAMKDSAMLEHYTRVADACPIPIILYNVPANTGVELSIEAIGQLSKHPNIFGLKESGGDISKIGQVVHLTKENKFEVLAGSAGFLLAALHLGCVGGVCALANVLYNEVCELYQLHKNNTPQAINLQHKLIGPNAAVTKNFGVAGLKQVMEWKGLKGGPCRPPLIGLTTSQRDELRKTFEKEGFL